MATTGTPPSTTRKQEPPTAHDEPQSTIDEIQDHWVELVTVLLLATASLAVAWGGYQSARWGGVQSTLYTRAGAARVESTRSETRSQLLAMTDLSIFNACASTTPPADGTLRSYAGSKASAEQSPRVDSCYEDQFSPELRAAMEAWLDTQPVDNPDAEADSGPMQVDEFVRRETVEAKKMKTEAEQLFAEGMAANQQSDDYVLTTVFLATVLFFCGISSRITWRPMRIGFLAFATTLLMFSLMRMAMFPVM